MIHINLLPVRVSRKKAAGKQHLIIAVAVVAVGYLANAFWASSRGAELAAVSKKVAATRDEIAQLDRIIGEVKNIKEQQAQLREKLDTLGRLKAGRTGPVKVLDALATLTPKRLWLTRLEERSNVLSFSGGAATIDDVSEFMSALKGNPHFSNIELTKTAAATSQRKTDYVDFTLTAAVTYTPGAGPAPDAPPAPGAPARKGR